MKTLIILILLIFNFNYSDAQVDFSVKIDKIYNFDPFKISKEEHKLIISELDSLFNLVKSDTTKYLPMLRQELLSNSHPPYFYYDCSHLLILTSKSFNDKLIAVEGFSKCDMKDIVPEVYVKIITNLSLAGANTTKAALKILERENFEFDVYNHGSITYNQGYCLMYCLLALNPNLYIDTLINRFYSVNNPNLQRAIITTIWFSYSCQGDSFLKSLKDNESIDKGVIEYSQNILTYSKFDPIWEKVLENGTEEQYNSFKLSTLKNYSPEAIEHLDMICKLNRKKYNCR